MPSKNNKSTIVTFRLDNDVLARLKRNHPRVSEYLRGRVTYDVTRKHRRKIEVKPYNEPIYRQHPDRGCTYHSSCFTCPYPKCLAEMSKKERYQTIKVEQNQKILQLIKQGKKRKEIAEICGISLPTISRILKAKQLNS